MIPGLCCTEIGETAVHTSQLTRQHTLFAIIMRYDALLAMTSASSKRHEAFFLRS
jgi:hypothetical protein